MNGLIACHIQQKEDLLSCIECIRSIHIQTQPLKRFYLSWSSLENFSFEMTNLCQYFRMILSGGINTVRIFHQPSRKKQFEHYQLLCHNLRENAVLSDQDMLIFGDADDQWDPVRVEFMFQSSTSSDHAVHVFNMKTVEDPNGQFFREYTQDLTNFEYWMCCIKFHVFRTFFQEMPHPRYLGSTYCDLAFDNYLLHQWRSHTRYFTREELEDKWLYLKVGMNSTKEGDGKTRRGAAFNFIETRLMEIYPNPLASIDDNEWNGYCPGNLLAPKFQIREPIDIQALATIELSPDYRALEEYLSDPYIQSGAMRVPVTWGCL
jgi:hypothetical protein